MPVANVVIVGAGLSGMVSALHLLDNGVTRPDSITVLEGRNRVGGRLQAHEGEEKRIWYCTPKNEVMYCKHRCYEVYC